MDMIFGAFGREDRANSPWMSEYFRRVSVTFSLSEPKLFLNRGFGIATSCRSAGDRCRADGMFRDAGTEILVVIQGDLVNAAELEEEWRADRSHGPGERWSAAELVWNMYRSYGLDFVSKIEGVANIAIWHERERRLILISDPFGFRPFYYVSDSGTFLFASSLKAILQHSAAARAVHVDALHDLLALGFILPPDTLFDGVKIVSPGEYLEFVDEAVVRRLPERAADHVPEGDEARMADEYLELLEDAVVRRIRGATSVAVLLSGGVDSSALVSILRTVGIEVITYSMHLDPADRQEREVASAVSRLFDTAHVELTTLGPTPLNDLPEIIWRLEVPRVEVVAEHALSEIVDFVAGPVLTGDGNDIPWGLFSPTFLETSGKNLVQLYLLLRQRMPDDMLSVLLPESPGASLRLEGRIARLSPETGNVFSDLISLDRRLFGAHFVNRMLGKLRVERGPMTFRFPYLDRRINRLVESLPAHFKVGRSRDGKVMWKYLFKASLERQGILPAHIVHRPKNWIHHPTSAWLRNGPGERLESLVLETSREALRYFDARSIRKVWREHRDGKLDHTHALETLLGFVLWHRIFIESKECGTPPASIEEMF